MQCLDFSSSALLSASNPSSGKDRCVDRHLPGLLASHIVIRPRHMPHKTVIMLADFLNEDLIRPNFHCTWTTKKGLGRSACMP